MKRARRRGAALAAAVGWLPLAAGAELVVERIGPANATERRIGGPDAIAGNGDWYLANDRIEVVVDAPRRRHATLTHGGTIVDAGLRGRAGDDQFARLFPILNLSQRVLLGTNLARGEIDPGHAARVVMWSSEGLSSVPRGGALARRFHPLVPAPEELARVEAETVYEVRPGEPFVRITTTLRNAGERPAPIFSFGDVWMRGGRSMRAFVGNTLDPSRSRGFHHESFDRDAILAARGAMAAYTFVAMAGLPLGPPVVYALFAPERVARGIPSFGVTGTHVTLAAAFVGDAPGGELGLLRLLRATRRSLAPGQAWRYERRLLVVPGDDVAAATDVIFPLLGAADASTGVEGRIEPSDLRASILVSTAAGEPVTQVSPPVSGPEAGVYRAVLPTGEYELTLRAAHRPPRRLRASVSDGGFTRLPPQRFEPAAALVFERPFADAGPGRVIVTPLDGATAPVFGAELLDFRLDGEPVPSGTETNELHFTGDAADPRRVEIAPGRYRLTALRGLEWELAHREVELAGPGAEARVAPFELRRASQLPDHVSADLHVHAEASDDSGMSNEARLRSEVAAGVDVMVSSDHDVLGWFEPALDATGLRGRIEVVQGVEATSSGPSPAAPWTIGHHNAWPVRYRPDAHRGGAPRDQDVGVADLYAALRADHGAEVIQLNHALPREPGVEDGAYLSHLATAGEPYDAARPIDAEPNARLLRPGRDGRTRPIDFDAMEVMNGSKFSQYLRLREVWYSLLRQGFRRTATGNSDTHGPDEPAGWPRNYVQASTAPFDLAAFDAALREGRSFFTTGPLILQFLANDGGSGDLVAAPQGLVEVRFAVSAASWVPVDEVRLLANGEILRRYRPLAPAERVRRIWRSDSFELPADAFLTLEAGAALDVDPAAWARDHAGDYTLVAPGFVPQALANPIFVDVDGNGRFDAPGPGPPGQGGALRLAATLAVVAALGLAWWRLRARQGVRGARTT